MHLKIFGYTLMLKELNIENNFHKQKITLFSFPHSWSQHRLTLPQMEGNMTHKPSLGTGGLIHSKQLMGRGGNPSKTKNSQPLKMSSFLLSRKSLSFMYFIISLRSRKCQGCLSDGKITSTSNSSKQN